jgi:hypothetical protein
MEVRFSAPIFKNTKMSIVRKGKEQGEKNE